VAGGPQGGQASALEGRRALRRWPPGETHHIGGRGPEGCDIMLLEYPWGSVQQAQHLPNPTRLVDKG